MTLLNGSLEEYPFKADETWLNMLKEASAKNVAKFETREQSDQLPMSHFNALGAIKKVYNKHHEDLILTNEEPIRSMIAATSSTCSNRAIVWTAARGV